MGCVPRDTTGGGLGAPQTQSGQTSEPANSSPDSPPKTGDSGARQLSPAGTPHSWPDSGGTGRYREGNLCGFARYLRPRIPPFAHTAWGQKDRSSTPHCQPRSTVHTSGGTAVSLRGQSPQMPLSFAPFTPHPLVSLLCFHDFQPFFPLLFPVCSSDNLQ